MSADHCAAGLRPCGICLRITAPPACGLAAHGLRRSGRDIWCMAEIVWFKRDLRVADHRPLLEAARRGPVIALYVHEPDYWALPDTSGRQWAFIAENLAELSAEIAARGGQLVLQSGDAVATIAALAEQHGATALRAHEETGNAWTHARDKRVRALCRRIGLPFIEERQFGVFRPLADRDMWARRFEAFMADAPLPPPERINSAPGIASIPLAKLPVLIDPCPGRQPGGRKAGLALLRSFLAGRGRRYPFEMSSPLTADTSCSRLSAHLAAGTLSMREVLHAALAARRDLARTPAEARAIPIRSVDALIARLHWHCHFIQKLESEPAIEWRAMHPQHAAAMAIAAPDDPVLRAWIDGRTGFPFVDACMRSLRATGWINFRMRAMLMAFASYHLNLDWRASGAALARLFTDYEPGIHWPQVQMQSGATGINTPRIYNPLKQSHDQDPEGRFIRAHLPEIAHLPDAFLHAPWLMDPSAQTQFGLHLGRDYPHRIIDHEEAARAARARLSALRHAVGYQAEARKVYARHGSRKRSLSNDDPARTRAINARKAEKAARQLSFDL